MWPFLLEPKLKKKKAKKKKKARKVRRVKVYKDLSEDPKWIAKQERRVAWEKVLQERRKLKEYKRKLKASGKAFRERKRMGIYTANKIIGQRDFITIDKVADMLNVSTRTLARMREDRGLPFYKVERRILFKEAEILEWMENRIEKQEEDVDAKPRKGAYVSKKRKLTKKKSNRRTLAGKGNK